LAIIELIKKPCMFRIKINRQNGTSCKSSAFKIKNNAPNKALPASIIIGNAYVVYLSVRAALGSQSMKIHPTRVIPTPITSLRLGKLPKMMANITMYIP
jgi:hypothetical protein